MAFLGRNPSLFCKPPRGCAWSLSGPFPRRALRALSCGILLFLTLFSVSSPAAQPYPSDQVKAVFIFNFAQFVEWPADVFESDTSPLVIGIVGGKGHPVANALEQVVKAEKIKNRPFRIIYFPDVASVRRCHILYFAPDTTVASPRIFADLQDKRILTIGETEDSLRNGAVIRFVTERKISLRINLKSAKASGLTISSKLLRLAEVVNY